MKRQSAGNSIERETSLNFRLIDCKTRRLVSASPRLKYTALSYVWERGIAGNIVPKSLLSPGIEDGLRATQALGYRYFWVDKICIDQTSDEDKRTQIAMMGDIYQRAELTLVLASGNESERIPGVGLRRRRHPWLTLGDYSLIQMPGEGFEMLRFSTLRRRGWTLQEEILSRRTLYFLRNQIMLVCNQAYWYEVSVNVAEVQVHNSQRNIDEHGKPGCLCRPGIYYTLRTLWKLIEAYTDRHLSDDSDTLRAVEGCLSLASTFQHPVKHILGVGVPEISQSYELRSYFTAGLCWFHFFGRLSRLAGPTWTWAGW
ncbi:Heterokaryon incompatibility protein (HET) domain containing protein, partial [Naviculisporaceae sp. PSN 640]